MTTVRFDFGEQMDVLSRLGWRCFYFSDNIWIVLSAVGPPSRQPATAVSLVRWITRIKARPPISLKMWVSVPETAG